MLNSSKFGSPGSNRGSGSPRSNREIGSPKSDRGSGSVGSDRGSDQGSHSTGANSPAVDVPSAELPTPAWLEQLSKKIDNPRIDLSDKNAVYQDLVSSHYHSIKKNLHQALVSDITQDDKESLITQVMDQLEKLSMQDDAQGPAYDEGKKQFNQKLLSDVLRHVDDDALLQHAYQRVESKLDELAQGRRGCMTVYTSHVFHYAVADPDVDPRKIEDKETREAAYRHAFYRGLESGLSDIRGARVKSIISVADDEQRLGKLKRHLLDRSFVSPTLQHQEDIRKVFASFRSESVKAKAFEVFAHVVRAEMHKLGKRTATLPARRAYVSHLAGAMTTFRSIKPGTPGDKAADLLTEVVDDPGNMSTARAHRNFPLEYRNLGTDAMAGHLPHMPAKLRQEVLNHIRVRIKDQESLEKPPEFKNDQVAKMIMASVLGYSIRPGEYPGVERSNYAKMPTKKARQDLVKLVYQNRHALTPHNKADLMKVFRHFKDEVSSEREQRRWSSLRVFTRGGRTVNRMNEIDDQSVPML